MEARLQWDSELQSFVHRLQHSDLLFVKCLYQNARQTSCVYLVRQASTQLQFIYKRQRIPFCVGKQHEGYMLKVLKDVPQVVNLVECAEYVDHPFRCVLLLMEYIEGIELFDLARLLHEPHSTSLHHSPCTPACLVRQHEHVVVYIIRMVLKSLDACHRRLIAHLDIKLENLMLPLGPEDEEHPVRLIDFGHGHKVPSLQQVFYCFGAPVGTPGMAYWACLERKPFRPGFADLFGVACLLFQLFTFANLFSEKRSRYQQTDLRYLKLSRDLLPRRFHHVFMQMMFHVNLDCRYYLQHPAFQLFPEDEESAKIQLRALIQNASQRKPLLDAKAKEAEAEEMRGKHASIS